MRLGFLKLSYVTAQPLPGLMNRGVGPALLRTVWFNSAWGLENFSEGAPHGLHSEGDNESYHITPGEVLGLLQTERTETTAFSAWSLTRPTAR